MRIKLTILLYGIPESESCSVMSDSLRPHGLYSPWSSPGQNTGMGSLSLLQGIFPTQGSNPALPHCRRILCQLNHEGSPRILDWVANPFSRGSSQPRDRTQLSCIAGGFFIVWVTREASLFVLFLCLFVSTKAFSSLLSFPFLFYIWVAPG